MSIRSISCFFCLDLCLVDLLPLVIACSKEETSPGLFEGERNMVRSVVVTMPIILLPAELSTGSLRILLLITTLFFQH
jgi:hypothetical protein